MNKHLVVSMLSAALTACSSAASLSVPGRLDAAGLSGATIDVSAQGGYAGVSTRHVASHDDRRFVYVSRHVCAQHCGAPSDSVSGTLSQAATDSLFNVLITNDPFSLRDDYGLTRNAADMFEYTVRLTANGGTKTIRFDDGTMPEPMRQILSAVRSSVSAARR
jgi:hypothetical protein